MNSRRVLTVAVAATALLSVSACGLESTDETEKEHSVVQAAGFQVGSIDVRDAYLTYPVGSATSPYLIAAFINEGNSPDTLQRVSIQNATVNFATSPFGSGGQSAATPSDLALPPGVVANTLDPSSGTTGTALVVTPNGTPPAIGTEVPVTFTFASAGTSQPVAVPVVAAGATTVPTAPVPDSQTPIPSASGEPAVD